MLKNFDILLKKLLNFSRFQKMAVFFTYISDKIGWEKLGCIFRPVLLYLVDQSDLDRNVMYIGHSRLHRLISLGIMFYSPRRVYLFYDVSS